MATSFSSELRRNYGPIILRVVLCATVAALIGKSYCADSTVSSSTENVFLEIAHDPNATSLQKETISILMENAGATTPEEAFAKIKGSPELSYNGRKRWISDLSPLAGFTHLTTLLLPDNAISDLTPLAGLTNLQRLRLMMNHISDISPLRSLRNLDTLELSGNQISDISVLPALKKLKSLYISNNEISDISHLADLPALSSVALQNNPIKNYAPLVALAQARPTLEIYAGQEFQEALIKSVPAKKQFKGLPIIGQWVAKVIRSTTDEAGTRIELSFNENGMVARTLNGFGRRPRNNTPPTSELGTFQVEGNILSMDFRGRKETSEFEILRDDLILKSEGQSPFKLSRQK